MKTTKHDDELLYVRLNEPKPNPMFTEWQRQSVRFLTYNKAVPCEECGRRSRHHWTLIVEFIANTMAHIVPFSSGLVHKPLAPVCRAHLLAPAWVKSEFTGEEDGRLKEKVREKER